MGRAILKRLCELGAGRFAHASGALWLEASRTAMVADVHLGYGWAQRRRGELGLVADSKSHPRLIEVVNELRPQRLVILGDLVHAPRPGKEERAAIEAVLRDLALRTEIVLVRGNHDRRFDRDSGDLSVRTVHGWQCEGCAAVHGDRLQTTPIPEGHLVLGQLHPALKVRDAAGASQKLRLFSPASAPQCYPRSRPIPVGLTLPGGFPPICGLSWDRTGSMVSSSREPASGVSVRSTG